MLNKPPVVVEDVRLQKIDPTLSKRLEETKLTSDKVNTFILNWKLIIIETRIRLLLAYIHMSMAQNYYHRQ